MTVKFPKSSRCAVDTFGKSRHVIWQQTLITRNDRWMPCLKVGMVFEGESIPAPKDGGDVAAGHWVDTFPTGELLFNWD